MSEVRDRVNAVLKKMNELSSSGDTEAAHVYADNALCEFLEFLGYGEVVKAYNQIDKWYA